MEIFINGEQKSVAAQITAAQLLKDMGLEGKRLAMEVNEQIVPKSNHQDYILNQGDKIEIVHAIGGG